LSPISKFSNRKLCIIEFNLSKRRGTAFPDELKNQIDFDGTGYVKNDDNNEGISYDHQEKKNSKKVPKIEAGIENVKIINETNLSENKTKRKPSLFPTLENLPDTRPKDKYKRKQSVADFTKNIYNMERSNVISKGAIPLSQRRLSQVSRQDR